MSKTIYQSTIQAIGSFVADVLADGMLITFKQGAPADFADYCLLHSHDVLVQPITAGNLLQLGNMVYPITAVGDVANENLKQLGHITIRFDGCNEAELPGSVHVKGDIPVTLTVGTMIKVLTP